MNIVFVPKLCTNPSHSNHELKKVKAPTQGSKSTTVIPRCILEWFSIDKGSSFLLESTVPAERMERRNLLEHRFPNRQPSSCAFFLLSFSSPCPRVFYPLRLHCVYLRKLARPRAATFLCRQCGPVCNDYRSSSPLLGTVVPGKTQFAQFPLLFSYRRGERWGTTMRNRGTLEKRWRRPRLDDDFPSEQIITSSHSNS